MGGCVREMDTYLPRRKTDNLPEPLRTVLKNLVWHGGLFFVVRLFRARPGAETALTHTLDYYDIVSLEMMAEVGGGEGPSMFHKPSHPAHAEGEPSSSARFFRPKSGGESQPYALSG